MHEMRAIPTMLQPGDTLQYSQRHDIVSFRRSDNVLRIRGEDKELLSIGLLNDFGSLCRLIGHTTGLSLGKTSIDEKDEKLWSCTFGPCLPKPDPMPLGAGDILRFDTRNKYFEILREDEPLYQSAGELWLSMDCFERLCHILASCCGLVTGPLTVSPDDRDIGSVTLLLTPS